MRRSLRVVSLAAVVAAAAAAWFFLAPVQLGGSTSYAVIYGSSMEPHLHRGDLVILRSQSGYERGQVVGYHSRELHRNVLHRIVGVRGSHFVFKGDNNSFLDPEQPAAKPALRSRVDRPAGRRRLARTVALAPQRRDRRRARRPAHRGRRLRRGLPPQAPPPRPNAVGADGACGRDAAGAAPARAPALDRRRRHARARRDIGSSARRRGGSLRRTAAGAPDRPASGPLRPARGVLVVLGCTGRSRLPVAVAPSNRTPSSSGSSTRSTCGSRTASARGSRPVSPARRSSTPSFPTATAGSGASCSRADGAFAGTGSCSPARSTCARWRTPCAGSRRRPACTTRSTTSSSSRASTSAASRADASSTTRSPRRSRSTSTSSGSSSHGHRRESRRSRACRRRQPRGRGPCSRPSPSSA